MNEGLLLVVDTATRTGVIGLARLDGSLLAADRWASAHRHGEELLSRLDALLATVPAGPADIAAIAVGTGPGSFTGLRIGLATAKTLAYGLGARLVGVPTSHALALAAAGAGATDEIVVTLPAGAHDRYLVRLRVVDGVVSELASPMLVTSISEAVGESMLVAVDLDRPEVAEAAAEVGRHAVDHLAAALARLAAGAIESGRRDDVAQLVPAYVALPRGIADAAASVEWSPDLR